MIGHILSATSIEECKYIPEYSTYFQPLKYFVLGGDEAINQSHDIYYSLYPHNKHISAKLVTFQNEGTYPMQARKLAVIDEYLYIDLSPSGYAYSEFPFHGFLHENQMMALKDYQAIVSYPVGQ